MMLRNDNSDPPDPTVATAEQSGSRLNLLLSYGGWRQQSAVHQLPSLLSPLGIQCIRAESGEEAERIIRTYPVHIAVVDLALPLRRTNDSTGEEAGNRILQLLRRLEQPPPTVVVRPQQPAARESSRMLCNALREGAFAVVDRPMHVETMLEVMRRIVRRYYADLWPASSS